MYLACGEVCDRLKAIIQASANTYDLSFWVKR